MANNTIDPYSYKQILQDRQSFRQAGGRYSNDFNMADTPGQQWFRILFHFYSNEETIIAGTDTNTGDVMLSGYGLLHPTWEIVPTDTINDNTVQNLWQYSTAYSYLVLNDEATRAKYLKEFICLLSNINTYSPWYWKEVKGLEALVAKKQAQGEFKFTEPQKITLTCLPDAVDNRIRTLIDLYRSAVFSWRTKREIVPANLRKFDMTICLVQEPVLGIHHPSDTGITLKDFVGAASKWITSGSQQFATANPVSGDELKQHMASYKIFELHGCEFDYTMGSEAYGTFENENGFRPEYSIPIFVDDIVEYSYNEFAPELNEIGDMVLEDVAEVTYSTNGAIQYTGRASMDTAATMSNNSDDKITQPTDVFNFPEDASNIKAKMESEMGSSITGQLLSFLSKKTSPAISKVVLGNLFGFSINRTVEAVQHLAKGNVSSTITGTAKAIRGSYDGSERFAAPYKQLDDNRDDAKTLATKRLDDMRMQSRENLFDDYSKEQVNDRTIELGNLFSTNTMLNNL